MTPKPQRIVIVADDFGMSDAVSLGILDALQADRITGVSVMTNGAAWRRNAASLRESQQACDVGLHINLTFGTPMGRPFLAGSAKLLSPARLFRALVRGAIPPGSLAQEIEAQWDAFEQSFGRPPDFIDGHQHVHVFPVVRHVVLDLLRRRGAVDSVWIRDSSDRLGRILDRGVALPHAVSLAVIGRGAGHAWRRAGIETNDGFSGVSYLSDKADLRREFQRHLTAPGARHLLMVHPGRDADQRREGDGIDARRSAELAFLVSADWPAMLSAAGLTPTRFRSL